MRHLISDHREFQNADWAMPAELVDGLVIVYERFTPDNIFDKYSWLFSNVVKLLEPPTYPGGDCQKRSELVYGFRSKALQEVNSQGGRPALITLAERTEEPAQVGFVLGKNDLVYGEENILMSEYIASANAKHVAFASGFVQGRFQSKGWGWVNEKLEGDVMKGWSAEQKANFFACLPFDEQTWALLETNNTDTQASYWSRIIPGFNLNIDAERVARKLIQYKRPHVAVDFLAFHITNEKAAISSELVAEVLEQLFDGGNDPHVQWGNIGYDISRLLEFVRTSGRIEESRIARLEWLLMPVLENFGTSPEVLHRELSRNPEFFVELIKIVFKSEDEDDEQVTGSNGSSTRIDLAFRLLDSWRICPGNNEDGSVDKEVLNNWVTQARAALNGAGRGVIGDQQIGQALASFTTGSDGAYPHEFVRDVIEELANPNIERGFEVRVFNNRGVTMRGQTEGGDQERALADRYMRYANQMKIKFPLTAAMFRRLADRYKEDGRREDIRAELTQDLWR